MSKAKKRASKRRTVPKDALSREKSRRHGGATKRGIKRARKQQHAVLKAVAVSRGMSKQEVVERLFHGQKCGMTRREVSAPAP
eukprot:4190744-Prymnesium_polylepis.1